MNCLVLWNLRAIELTAAPGIEPLICIFCICGMGGCSGLGGCCVAPSCIGGGRYDGPTNKEYFKMWNDTNADSGIHLKLEPYQLYFLSFIQNTIVVKISTTVTTNQEICLASKGFF